MFARTRKKGECRVRTIPQDAAWLLSRLNEAGYQAYVVGGCVRDALLGREPADWDVCTSATPEEMAQVFAGCHVVETGLKHGTLTVVRAHVPYEVTTFRVEEGYTDHRHPDRVRFVTDVRADLARRDFTVNAMAYHPETGLVDAFHGQEDLAAGVLRCVGDPATRFGEDALRILRALRFAAVYDFHIEEETARAVHELAPTLAQVAAERIRTELGKLLCGKAAARVLRDYADVIHVILPQTRAMQGFEQHTPYHRYDVWEHTLRVVEQSPQEEGVRLAALLHDAGKPRAFTLDAQGVGHAYGHQAISAELAEEAMARLKMDRATWEDVTTLVVRHDIPLPAERRMMKRRLSQLGERRLRLLIALQRADALGKGTLDTEAVEAETQARLRLLDELLAEDACVTLRQLAVNGRDLLAAGLPGGKALGETLQALLDAVLDERLPNSREELLTYAQTLKEAGHASMER